MTSLDQLLPSTEEAPRCADHGRSIGLDPGGTAIRADRLLLVATPLPWPKPVFDHPTLLGVRDAATASALPTRPLGFVPDGSTGNERTYLDGGSTEVVLFDRGRAGSAIERRFVIEDAEAMTALLAAVSRNDVVSLDSQAATVGPVTSLVVLVCTQGSHDVCCGSDGARFAAEVDGLPGCTVYRVSHTGGHRFAPTALTLPDGRMWADLDLAALRQIMSKTGDPSQIADRCRGWWGADVGPAQVAERAVFEAAGWATEAADRVIDDVGPGDGDPPTASRFAVTVAGERWEVVVEVGREVPTISCRQPGGQPAKPGWEYRVTDLKSAAP